MARSDVATELSGRIRSAVQAFSKSKDVELVSLLLLLTEEGVRSYSQPDLDEAYSDRDESWEKRIEVETTFRNIVTTRLSKELLSDQHWQEPVLAATRTPQSSRLLFAFTELCVRTYSAA